VSTVSTVSTAPTTLATGSYIIGCILLFYVKGTNEDGELSMDVTTFLSSEQPPSATAAAANKPPS